MPTGQKYSGKGDDATPPDQNAQSIEQTVVNTDSTANPAPQAENYDHLADALSPEELAEFMRLSSEERALVVSLADSGQVRSEVAATIHELLIKSQPHTLPEGIFDFDELAIFAGLSDKGKEILSTLANSGSYQHQQLKRALRYISQTSGAASPSDEFNGESLQSILAGEPGKDEQLQAWLSHPVTLVGGVVAVEGRTLVRLTDYLEEVTNSEESTQAFKSQVVRMVSHYYTSKEYLSDPDPDKAQKLIDFAAGISGIAFRADLYKRPLHERTPIDPRVELENPFKVEAFEVLLHNPANITNLDQLREMVAQLQHIVAKGVQVNSNFHEMQAIRAEQVGLLNDQITTYKELVAQLKQKIPVPKPTPEVPEPRNREGIDLYLSLMGYGFNQSMVDVVRDALVFARDAKLKETLGEIVVDNTQEAFCHFDNYKTLQGVLDTMATELADIATENSKRSSYLRNQVQFEATEKRVKKQFFDRQSDFVEEYSIYTSEGNEDVQSAPGPADPEATTETRDQTPES